MGRSAATLHHNWKADAEPVRSILLIEDNLADVFIIEQILEMEKLPLILEVARDGEEGMSVLRQEERRASFCAVLLDLGLPKIPGLEILASAQREVWNLPIIVITCIDWPTGLEKIIELGAAGYFRKPFSLAEYSELPKVLFTALDRAQSWENTLPGPKDH